MQVIGEWSSREIERDDEGKVVGIGPAIESGCWVKKSERLPWRCLVFGHRFDVRHPFGICKYLGFSARTCLRCGEIHARDKEFCETMEGQTYDPGD